MRISSNYQSYNLNNATAAKSTDTKSILSNLQNANSLFNNASVSSDSTSSSSVDDIMSQMANDPRMQMMRMKINSADEGTQANMEKMKTAMDTLKNADLETMSLEDKQALLEEVQTTMAELHGEREDAVAVSDMTEEELTSILEKMQSHALKGLGGPGGPGGPPPGGPPPGGKAGGVDSVSGTTEEESALTTLEALLEAIAEDEETKETENETSDTKAIQEQTFKNAIEQYFKNQKWDTTDLKAIFEA